MGKVFFALALAAAVWGCTPFQDNLPYLPEAAGKGCIDVEFVDGGIFTKGTAPLDASTIGDVYLYIFDEAGGLVYHNHFPDSNVSVEDIVIYTGNRYTVYALANWVEELHATSREELEELVCRADDVAALAGSGAGAVLHGKLENVKLTLGRPLEVPMQRILGKVNVSCDFSRLGDGVFVEVKEVSICNVPVETLLFKDNVAEEVTSGRIYEEEELSGISVEGVDFHLFENLQGAVPGASGNKGKALLLGADRRALCTYVEMKCYLVTNAHRGDIVYRFYLGTSHQDCNVYRNAEQKIKVCFIGNASQDEYSVSVDNRSLLDRVTSIIVQPAAVYFAPGLGKTKQCTAIPQPATAFDKRITWESSDTSVAVVDENGLVTTTGPGECLIIARSVENPSETGRVHISVSEEE